MDEITPSKDGSNSYRDYALCPNSDASGSVLHAILFFISCTKTTLASGIADFNELAVDVLATHLANFC